MEKEPSDLHPEPIYFETPNFKDKRGTFNEIYSIKKLPGIEPFVQFNQSTKYYGAIAGLHYQLAPHGQAKFIWVPIGEIFDVAVDIRPDSPEYGRVYSRILSAENNGRLYIPQGFAHGYSVLSEEALIIYGCDNVYNKDAERGFHYASLGIDWQIPEEKRIISEKDSLYKEFKMEVKQRA